MSYLIKGLVKRPDDQSASRQLDNKLGLSRRSKTNGFPSIDPDALSKCMTRVDGVPDVDRLRIFKYFDRHKPAGARLKTSRAKGAVQPSVTADEERSTPSLRDAEEPVPETSAAIRAAAKANSQASDSLLTEEDDMWVEDLVNKDLARWIWASFPSADKRLNIPLSRLLGPFRFRSWPDVTIQGLRHTVRTKNKNGFTDVAEILFPADWRLTGGRGPQWANYQRAILDGIILRVRSRPETVRSLYSSNLRRSIIRRLSTWEYLPAVQKRKVWAVEGKAQDKAYGLHSNPSVLKVT